jgi:hypothetical protein
MIGNRRATICILTLFSLYLVPDVSSQRAIVSLGKRLQQRFSGSNKQHISDFAEGEKTKSSSTRWYEASTTTLLLVALGLYFYKRFAGGGEFAIQWIWQRQIT